MSIKLVNNAHSGEWEHRDQARGSCGPGASRLSPAGSGKKARATPFTSAGPDTILEFSIADMMDEQASHIRLVHGLDETV
jgi:hypothetical protein